jgi:hypothetical protein
MKNTYNYLEHETKSKSGNNKYIIINVLNKKFRGEKKIKLINQTTQLPLGPSGTV